MNITESDKVLFSNLIKTGYDFRDISLQIKDRLKEANVITESTTYETFTNDKKLQDFLKRQLALGLSNNIDESKFGKPFVNDFCLFHNLKNELDVEEYCRDNGIMSYFFNINIILFFSMLNRFDIISRCRC